MINGYSNSYLILQQISISILSLISFNDTIHNDQLSLIAKLIISLSSILYLIFSTQYLKSQKLSSFEYYIILSISIFGFFLLCGANDLITAYLAIELQGLSFYVLASFKKSSNFSIESGVKYFVLGSLSTAIFLLGSTFIYGFSGSVVLTDFKDFFIWVFSANSFFLAFDSIFKALEIFQEKIALNDSFVTTKLQIVLDKLDLFKKKFYMLPSDLLLFSFTDSESWEILNLIDDPDSHKDHEGWPFIGDKWDRARVFLKQLNLSKSISNKILTLSSQIDDFSYFYYEDHNYIYYYSDEFSNYLKKTLIVRDSLLSGLYPTVFMYTCATTTSSLIEDNLPKVHIYYYDLKNQLVEHVRYRSFWEIDTDFLNFCYNDFNDKKTFYSSLIIPGFEFFDFNRIPSSSQKYAFDFYFLGENFTPSTEFGLSIVSSKFFDQSSYHSMMTIDNSEALWYDDYSNFNKCTRDLLKNQFEVLGRINPDVSLETPLQEYFPNHSYRYLHLQQHFYSLVNILSLSSLFLELSDMNFLEYHFMFEFSFIIFGFLIIILAIFFKLALAPFHLWAPDVYEGSPSSSTFFFMIISKFSLFVFLLRLCYLSFYSLITHWQLYSLVIATISIFIGAIAGLKQRRLKSLLTYSSINNMGFVLLALSTGSFEGIQAKFYYLIIYIISGLCIWAIILNLKLKKKSYINKQNRDLGDFVLLQESNNIIAQNVAITLFTLAGLPPMAGFLAKMAVFKALSGVSIYFFSLINILFSVIATFYYIRIVKIIFFENLLVGKLYYGISTKKTFIINLLTFLLIFLFISPMLPYFYSYKISLFLNKAFY